MKFIRQKSTGKIVHREVPHTDITIENAVLTSGVPIEDLEVADESTWTDQQYMDEVEAEKPYDERRRRSYPPIGDQLDAIWKGGDDADEMKAIVNKVKTDNPKEAE